MRVRSSSVLWCLLASLSIAVGLRAADAPFTKLAEIHVGGAGAFDYLTVDPSTKRLYLSHGTEVVVIDLSNNKVIGKIADTPGVHGVAVAPGPGGRLFTSNGRENKVSIVDPMSFATIGKVDTGANPDAIMYEPKEKAIYAFNHTGGSATVIDAASGKVIGTVPLEGAVETGQSDPGLGKVFVNIEDKDTVDVIDTATHTETARWPIAPAGGGTGMAIDPAAHHIFVGGEKFVVMMDAQSGKVLASAPICNGTDATSFDPGTGNVLVSCSDGHITVVHVDGPAKLSVVQTINTAQGARTNAVDPTTHRVYVAAQDYKAADPSAPAQANGRPARPTAVPDTLHVLVYGTK
jgi:DNA-binding beta-propeller fold protein YncE